MVILIGPTNWLKNIMKYNRKYYNKKTKYKKIIMYKKMKKKI